MASAPSDNNLALWRQLGAQTTHDNADVILGCDVIFLSVKPHLFPEVTTTFIFCSYASLKFYNRFKKKMAEKQIFRLPFKGCCCT
jgi:hypothetical protein